MNILISEPGSEDQRPYLPYIWAILKSFYSHHGEAKNSFHWLDPVYKKSNASLLLKPYENSSIDVLGLSCYSWNWELQHQIAREVKSRNPNCLVIAGGPQPDHQDPQFFLKNSDFDVVVLQDGEITFSKILTRLAQGQKDFTDIGGLFLPGPDGKDKICTGRPEVPVNFVHSPYIEQSIYFERILAEHPDGYFNLIWETNRGCPYSCSFCDWGSSTMSKVRKFDLQRIKDEADWISRMKINFLFLADANFGILERDLEICDFIISAYEKYGFPKFLYYSPAKNNPDRTVKIAAKMCNSGVAEFHTLAIQHTREEVLAATDRANISVEKQVQAVKILLDQQIPTEVQLIIGIPGDTYELWKCCLADLMEWGIHDDYVISTYILLPNAPAAAKAFVEKWEVKIFPRHVIIDTNKRRKKNSKDVSLKSDVLLETKTYTRNDWVKMKTYSAFVQALHNRGATRLIAMYLHFTHRVSYREFYEKVIENHLANSQMYQAVWRCNEEYSLREDQFDDMEIEQLPNFDFSINPSRWIFFQICYDLDKFFGDLEAFLISLYPNASHLKSLINYQKDLIITPTSMGKSKTFETEFDWVEYFKIASRFTTFRLLEEPKSVPGVVIVSDSSGANEIAEYSRQSDCSEAEWIAWMEKKVLNRNSASKDLYRNEEFVVSV